MIMLHEEVDFMFVTSVPEHGHLKINYDVFVSSKGAMGIIVVLVQEIQHKNSQELEFPTPLPCMLKEVSSLMSEVVVTPLS